MSITSPVSIKKTVIPKAYTKAAAAAAATPFLSM
jgi:hypothetical protein